MVYVDHRDLGYGPYYDHWVRSKSNEAVIEVLSYLGNKYISQSLAFLRQEKGRSDEAEPPEESIKRSDVSVVSSS